MVFNATLNNISVISWRTVLLVEETGVPGETTDLPQVTDKLMMLYLIHLGWTGFQLITLVVIGTDCMGICKTNYHTMTTTTTPYTPINSDAFILPKYVKRQSINQGKKYKINSYSKTIFGKL
jgi:hypothetical protein